MVSVVEKIEGKGLGNYGVGVILCRVERAGAREDHTGR